MHNVPEISVQELATLLQNQEDFVLLDVRNQDEYDRCNLGGILIPLPILLEQMLKLDHNKRIIVHCHAGVRSKQAAALLLDNGFKSVSSLHGGIVAWAQLIDPEMIIS